MPDQTMNDTKQQLAEFQQNFCHYLRNQGALPRPDGTAARGMKTYQELVYNNLEGFILACFPVCRAILGQRRWKKMILAYFANYRSQTPYFREIPQYFLEWLKIQVAEGDEYPAWFYQLAHWEWTELAVLVHDDTSKPAANGYTFNPTLALCAYDWPVHSIQPRRKVVTEPTYLLAYRNQQEAHVTAVVLSAANYQLLSQLQQGTALELILQDLVSAQLSLADLRIFANQMLMDMQQRSVILQRPE